MAPIKKLSKKEIEFKQKPWLTKGILKSIKIRDKIYKKFLAAKDPLNKQKLFRDFKIKRNIITTLIRDSKSQYYKNYFDENSKNAKKSWDGIREILKVSTKNRSLPTKLTDGKTMLPMLIIWLVNSMNFTSISVTWLKCVRYVTSRYL